MIFGSPVHLVNFVMDLPLMNPLSVEHKKTIIKAGARILDTIWKLRNRAVHEGVIPNLDEMRRRLFMIHYEIWNPQEHSIQDNRSHKVIKWSKPNLNCYKINCDAAVFENYAVILAVARDWRGFWVFAQAIRVNTNSLIQAEAEALRWAVRLAISHNLHNVIVEGDNKTCIQVLKGTTLSSPWKADVLLRDTKELAMQIENLSFNWVLRDANVAAHSLTVWALKQSFDFFDASRSSPRVLRMLYLRRLCNLFLFFAIKSFFS